MHGLTRGAITEVEAPKENPICHTWHDSVLDAALKAVKSSPRIHMEWPAGKFRWSDEILVA